MLLVAAALIGIGALSASAASAFEWQIEGKSLANGVSETVTVEKVSEKFTFESTLFGASFKQTAFGLKGLETKITQSGAVAAGSGKFQFTGVTVDEPASCKVKESMLTTKPTKSEVVEIGGVFYEKIVPAEGETLISGTLEGCAIAGTFLFKGSVFGQVEKAGVALVCQPLKFSKTIQEAAGGTLALSSKPVFVTGEAKLCLSGANAGKKFSFK